LKFIGRSRRGTENPYDLCDLGWDLLEAADYRGAEACFGRAAELGWVGGLLCLGELSRRLGDEDAAIQQFTSAANWNGRTDDDKAVKDQAACQLVPLLYRKGRALGNQGDIRGAEECFRKVFALVDHVLSQPVDGASQGAVALVAAHLLTVARADGSIGDGSVNVGRQVQMLEIAVTSGDGSTRDEAIEKLTGVVHLLTQRPELVEVVASSSAAKTAWQSLCDRRLVIPLSDFERQAAAGSPVATNSPKASARFCTNCGENLPEGVRFCGSCGHRIQSG
jgi:tetratricopeptide (TPR) repeat protein